MSHKKLTCMLAVRFNRLDSCAVALSEPKIIFMKMFMVFKNLPSHKNLNKTYKGLVVISSNSSWLVFSLGRSTIVYDGRNTFAKHFPSA